MPKFESVVSKGMNERNNLKTSWIKRRQKLIDNLSTRAADLNFVSNDHTTDVIRKYKEKFDDVVPVGRNNIFRKQDRGGGAILGFNKLQPGKHENMVVSTMVPGEADRS